jgi:hypothetical protein
MKVVFDENMMRNINQFLTSLGDTERHRLYTSALKKAVKPMVDTARDYAPFKTGRLFYSIDVIKNPNHDYGLLFGIKAGGIYVGHWYGRWQDRGWQPRQSKVPEMSRREKSLYAAAVRSGRRHIKAKGDRVPGAFFIRKGYEQNEDSMIPIFNKELNKIVAAQIKKYTKK